MKRLTAQILCVSILGIVSCSDDPEIKIDSQLNFNDKELIDYFNYPPFRNDYLLVDWSSPTYLNNLIFYSIIDDSGSVFSEKDENGVNTYKIFKQNGEYHLLKTRITENTKTGKKK